MTSTGTKTTMVQFLFTFAVSIVAVFVRIVSSHLWLEQTRRLFYSFSSIDSTVTPNLLMTGHWIVLDILTLSNLWLISLTLLDLLTRIVPLDQLLSLVEVIQEPCLLGSETDTLMLLSHPGLPLLLFNPFLTSGNMMNRFTYQHKRVVIGALRQSVKLLSLLLHKLF